MILHKECYLRVVKRAVQLHAPCTWTIERNLAQSPSEIMAKACWLMSESEKHGWNSTLAARTCSTDSHVHPAFKLWMLRLGIVENNVLWCVLSIVFL
jgi:methylphosphotriester-DNA--protein-cysteine methyltransferase